MAPDGAPEADDARFERTIVDDPRAIEALADEWRALASVGAGSPFETPDWLLPWLRHYGGGRQPFVVTWRRDGRLVGLAPLVRWSERRAGRELRNLTFWGETRTPFRGWVDILATDQDRTAVTADFNAWLATPESQWHVLHCLRLPYGSPTAAALAEAGWFRASLTEILWSTEYVLDIPVDAQGWTGPLGRKARYNIRREARLFESEAGGSIARLTDPAAVPDIVEALRRLLAARWGPREAYFRVDPAFEGFVGEALTAAFAAGSAEAHVASDATGIVAIVVILVLNGTTVTLFAANSHDAAYSRYSLGKSLFAEALEAAVAAHSTVFDFLTVGEYKEAFWGARGRDLESLIVGRGTAGRAVIAYAALRRRLGPLIRRVRGGWRRNVAGDAPPPSR